MPAYAKWQTSRNPCVSPITHKKLKYSFWEWAAAGRKFGDSTVHNYGGLKRVQRDINPQTSARKLPFLQSNPPHLLSIRKKSTIAQWNTGSVCLPHFNSSICYANWFTCGSPNIKHSWCLTKYHDQVLWVQKTKKYKEIQEDTVWRKKTTKLSGLWHVTSLICWLLLFFKIIES